MDVNYILKVYKINETTKTINHLIVTIILRIISPLIYVAIGSFGTAFAVSASDITVKGNDDTWDEGADSLNHINNGDVQIAITSNYTFRLKASRMDENASKVP